MLFKGSFTPWLMWGLCVLFFAFQFIFRLWPSLNMQGIMAQFSIDASAFGFLSALYYVGYAGCQIPMAIALERFGPRWIVGGSAILCGFAMMLFTYAPLWEGALLGRFLIGVASAAGFLGVSKATALWFPSNHYARMVGMAFTLGLMGALYGGMPVHAMIVGMGTIPCAMVLSGGALLIGCAVLLAFRQPSQYKAGVTLKLSDLKPLLMRPELVFLALANLLMVGVLEGFADVWGVNYLMSAYHMEKGTAAGCVSFIFVGMVFGGPLLAWMGERWGLRRLIALSGFGMAGLFLILLWGELSYPALVGLFFCLGILCCYQVLVFAFGAGFVSPFQLGITVAFLNCINMLGGTFFHALIGFCLDLAWRGESIAGVRDYDAGAYKVALLIIPLCATLGAMILHGLKRFEGGSQKQYDQAA